MMGVFICILAICLIFLINSFPYIKEKGEKEDIYLVTFICNILVVVLTIMCM